MEQEILLELDKIIETSNNNITITDEHGIIIRSNPDHWKMYGIEADSYVGKSVYELEKNGVLSPSINALVLKEQKEVRIMQHTKSGRVVMSTGYPVFNQAGQLVRAISYSQDQTEIVKLQEQYEQLQSKIVGFQTEVEELRVKEASHHPILFRSSIMQHMFTTIQRVAQTDATILFSGESGVGKSTLARFIHDQSERHKEPFIEVNCSTIPETLFESEMFGYEPGSFTGAHKSGKKGLIEQADQGTLFLDEIGELPLAIQVKLLRVLQEKKLTKVGGKEERHVNFRLITATNQQLKKMVDEGTFRLDLYYRLNVIPIQIPSLRERQDDIMILLQHYLKLMNKKYNVTKKLHPTTYDSLIHYDWPGNVREMENLLERLILTIEDPIIAPEHLPYELQVNMKEAVDYTSHYEQEHAESKSLKEALEEVEIHLLSKAYTQCKTTYEMAEVLGISQPSVMYKLKKYKEKINR
ncbi:sigma 54-interacting transcriptional regulator [Alkalihalobacillus sp. MEB130]|uniref:sigma-54 interaction domain-containing protein n=1 Tax=Alkalihalobacillus sp. MEB130 TaxID=2976704 RepID=UPI0028DD889A|nr:sigma 54-interacting transcriptional regulator [Alkalihalobacillus sp. MEB130]MDT8862917.1 sigma 54-interacting transcriptional regulator [Alkalihalobacillus sp. MEB130]